MKNIYKLFLVSVFATIVFFIFNNSIEFYKIIGFFVLVFVSNIIVEIMLSKKK